ncbi:MAG: hypothetical protein HFH82_17470 [Lachnospiraceae bacterium]|nr:hypothetical protein [Lachnospiraceae bacterium]
MNLNQILELSVVLDNEHFRKVFPRLYKGDGYIAESGEEYINQSLNSKGITVIYRDSQYKKKIRLIVNMYLLINDASDIDRLIRKLDKRIIEYFNGKYRIDDFGGDEFYYRYGCRYPDKCFGILESYSEDWPSERFLSGWL